jgi:hypothetical protein
MLAGLRQGLASQYSARHILSVVGSGFSRNRLGTTCDMFRLKTEPTYRVDYVPCRLRTVSLIMP